MEFHIMNEAQYDFYYNKLIMLWVTVLDVNFLTRNEFYYYLLNAIKCNVKSKD